VVEYFKNGKIKCEYDSTEKGKIDGIYKKYYESGEIHTIRNFTNGKLNGQCFEYYLNGKLKNQTRFTLSKPNGLSIDYDSRGKIIKRVESILVYKNMFYEKSAKFLEQDTINIDKKEDHINSCLYYHNDILVQDSSYYCSFKFTNKTEKIKLGDSIRFSLSIPLRYFSGDDGKTVKFMTRIEDSNHNNIILKPFICEKRNSIPSLDYGSFKPTKKGIGYIYGAIMEVTEKKEGHGFYFKRKYLVE